MTPPRTNLRIRVPLERPEPVIQQWTGAPDGSICLLLVAVMGLTAVACWMAHIAGMPPTMWWMLFT